MSKPKLSEIEVRAEGATSAPWSHVDAGFRDSTGHSVKSDPSGMVVAFGGFGPAGGGSCSDAAFIAAARTDVPALTAAIRAVEAAMDHLDVARAEGLIYTYGQIQYAIRNALAAHLDLS